MTEAARGRLAGASLGRQGNLGPANRDTGKTLAKCPDNQAISLAIFLIVARAGMADVISFSNTKGALIPNRIVHPISAPYSRNARQECWKPFDKAALDVAIRERESCGLSRRSGNASDSIVCGVATRPTDVDAPPFSIPGTVTRKTR